MATEASSQGTTWASWMDDRTTTAYSPHAHPLMPRAATAGDGRMLRAAPSATVTATARARADEAGLMWLDDADLLSVSESSFTAAESGSLPHRASAASIAAKCLLPALGLFVAVLFGQVILAASGRDIAPSEAGLRVVSPRN